MNRHHRLFAVVALAALLSACGAKGPLFMPEKPAEEVPVEPAAEPAPPADGSTPAQPPVDPSTVPAHGTRG